MLIGLHIVYGCFHIAMARLSSCNTDCMAHEAENIFYLALDRKGFPIFDLWFTETDQYKSHKTGLL